MGCGASVSQRYEAQRYVASQRYEVGEAAPPAPEANFSPAPAVVLEQVVLADGVAAAAFKAEAAALTGLGAELRSEVNNSQ